MENIRALSLERTTLFRAQTYDYAVLHSSPPEISLRSDVTGGTPLSVASVGWACVRTVNPL